MIWREETFTELIEATRIYNINTKPSEWYEKNMVMPPGSAFPGPFSFDKTPYWREPLDCAAKDHPAKEVTIKGGAQVGKTVAVLNPIVGYTISQNPGNIMFLTGHSELSEQAILKVDTMIDNTGLRPLIRPNVLRAKNSRTGDTNKNKEYAGGSLVSGSVTNHNLLRQYDIMIMIVDDYDAALMKSKQAGSTRRLVQKRTAAYANKKKIYWVSSPQIEGLSNIDQVFKLSDQRYYNVPCPCCHSYIVLKWEIEINDKEKAGMTWELDNHGRLKRDSVGYICQNCAGFFNSSHKYEMNLHGFWEPTAVPIEENHYGYHISSLYSPPGMDDWAHYAQQYIEANPHDGRRDEPLHQTFTNVVLGESYKQSGEAPKANDLQKNTRPYEIGTVPEKLSIADGNGRIILISLACDLNGTEDDARLDYEVLGWSESGSTYSIVHGSIGTFIPKEGPKKKDRVHWTYQRKKNNSVWPELDKVLGTIWQFDTGRQMRITISGVDCGWHSRDAYGYLDSTNFPIVGLKGKDLDKMTKFNADLPPFRPAKERKNLYLVEVNRIKDLLAERMKLKWDQSYDQTQPPDFMNYPTPGNGLYEFNSYFKHYEAEHRTTEDKDGNIIAALWRKKSSISQNHFWDVRVYNIIIRDIFMKMLGDLLKEKNFTWEDYRRIAVSKIKT